MVTLYIVNQLFIRNISVFKCKSIENRKEFQPIGVLFLKKLINMINFIVYGWMSLNRILKIGVV